MQTASQIDLQKLRFAVSQRISQAQLLDFSVDTFQDFFTEDLTYRLKAAVWARHIGSDDVRFPADWWQAFKERWFPRWVNRRWPVQYRTFTIDAWHKYPALQLQGRESVLEIRIREGGWLA